MLNVGDKLICTPKDAPENMFSIRAEVLKIKDGLVTISRALKFGKLPMQNLTLPKEDIFEFYTLVEDSK